MRLVIKFCSARATDEILNGSPFLLFSVLESVTQIPDGHDSTSATSKESHQQSPSAAASPNDIGGTGGGGAASVGSPGKEPADVHVFNHLS